MPQTSSSLRVLHIISGDLWAGAEAQAFTLLTQLKSKVDLHVVLMNQFELATKLNESGIATTIIPEQTVSSVKIALRLAKLICQQKPDIIHTHRQKENILGSIANILSLPFRFKITPSIRTTHGAPEFAPTGKQRIQVAIDTWIAKHVQRATIAVSKSLGEQLNSIYGKDKVFIIENGIDVAALKAKAHTADFRKTEPKSIHVGIIGRIEPVKRIDIFIDMAAHALQKKNATKKMQFHIIGDGKLLNDMKQKVSESSNQSDIIFHGHRTDIPSCISSLDLIIMCSDHEGTPMTALEALALGTPMIAHSVGGLKEVLAAYPKLLVETHTSIGYAEKLLEILDDQKIHVELDPIYSAMHNANRTLNLYMTILK